MRFIVTRTTHRNDGTIHRNDEPPCEEAFEGVCTHVHARTCKTFEEYDERFGRVEGTWLSIGTNHRLIANGIARDEDPQECFFVELNSLEDLVAFQGKYGALVIQNRGDNAEGYLEIEIYDDYRE